MNYSNVTPDPTSPEVSEKSLSSCSCSIEAEPVKNYNYINIELRYEAKELADIDDTKLSALVKAASQYGELLNVSHRSSRW